MKIIIALLVASLFLLSILLLRLLAKRISTWDPRIRLSENAGFLTEIFIWIIYIFWLLHFLFSEMAFYSYFVIGLIIIISGFTTWFLLRDIFGGLFFRLKHNLKTGSYIQAGEISGEIKNQKLTHLRLISGDGQMLRIPYHLITNEIITELSYPGTLEEHLIHVQVDSSYGKVNSAESFIRSVLLNTPWSNLKEEPAIRLVEENEKVYLFEVTLLSINLKHLKNIEMAIEEIPEIHVIQK